MRLKMPLIATIATSLMVPAFSTLAGSSVSAEVSAAAASKLYADVQIDISCDGAACTSSTIAESNTTRKLAVLADGTIAATFRAASGIYVATSANRGSSFSTPVKVTSDSREAEIAASSAGTLYVAWNTATDAGNGEANVTYKISKSTDKGATWSSPVEMGNITTRPFGPPSSEPNVPLHLAVDGDYIYGVNQDGSNFFRSTDAGRTWATSSLGESRAFADVHVDPLTGNVYVFTDDPIVRYFSSTDRGATFSAETTTSVSVMYSVGGLTSNGTDRYFYMVGSGTNLERINLNNNTVETKTVERVQGQQTRSLAADACGNVVTGHKTGTDLYFQYSTDSGSTFSTAEQVVAAGDRANASINPNNGDVLFLYEKSNKIYLTTYSGVLAGSCYAITLSKSAIEFTAPGEVQEIVLTNTSSAAVNLSNITISGSTFTMTNNCPASLAPAGTCTIRITGKSAGAEVLRIVAGDITKLVPVKMGAIAAAKPPVSAVDTKVYRRLPEKIGNNTAHIVLSSKARKTQRITTQTPSICVATNDTIITLKPGTCRYAIVSKKTGSTLRRGSTKVIRSTTDTGTQLTRADGLYFGPAGRRLLASSQSALVDIATQAASSSRVLVLGYTANLTDQAAFNNRTSEYRAAEVKRQLQKLGVTAPISIRAMGSVNLVTTKKTERAQAQNRRVEVLLWP